MMTLEEAIKHCKDIALSCTNKECALEHFQLLKWLQEYRSILEKQDEKKLADKVEPKFKVGDWINGYYTNYKVLSVNNDGYLVEDVDGNKINILFENEKFHHLFTIADAKAGDVLFTKNRNIFIFKSISGCSIHDYCGLYFGKFTEFSGTVNGRPAVQLPTDYVPATKEQRDTLVEAMTNAGYTFDFEKKELKKIENEIEIPFGAKDSELQEVTYFIPKGFHAEIDDDKVVIKKGENLAAWSEEDIKAINRISTILVDASEVKNWWEEYRLIGRGEMIELTNFLKSLKNRVGCEANCTTTKEWSEEDKRKIDRIYSILRQAADTHAFSTSCRLIGDKECIELQDFLKSLKDRYTWKPSDEQMKALAEALSLAKNCGEESAFDLRILYEQLKKLKE